MRFPAITLGALLLAASLTPAQQGQPPAAPPAPTGLGPAKNQLDAVLLQWEKEMGAVQSLAAQLQRTTLNRVFNSTDVAEGSAKYLKPNKALLELRKKGDAQVFEKLVFTGTFIFEFRPQQKVIVVHDAPPAKPGQVADDNVMSFVFGMKAEEAKRRYEMTLQKPEDPNYFYVAIQPRFPQDKDEFIMARLVLLKRNYLPRQFWYVQPNKNEVTYDILQIEPNGKNVAATDFLQPKEPPGWKMERAPRPNPQAGGNVPPRVVRPNQ